MSLFVQMELNWDTAAKIKMLNQQDADYNNITIEEMLELLNKK